MISGKSVISIRLLYISAVFLTPSILFFILTNNSYGYVREFDNRTATGDTLQITLQQAETLFLDQNLLLIAERLNLDVIDAEIRQARLWANPEVSLEHQIINREQNGPVGFTGSDNTVFEIEQLIFTAGKRGRLFLRSNSLFLPPASAAAPFVFSIWKKWRPDISSTCCCANSNAIFANCSLSWRI